MPPKVQSKCKWGNCRHVFWIGGALVCVIGVSFNLQEALFDPANFTAMETAAMGDTSLPQQESPTPTRLRLCRVAVMNSLYYHYETLESVAELMPDKYLNLPPSKDTDSQQNCGRIVFDYHVLDEGDRVASGASYFHTHLEGRNCSGIDDGPKRTIGTLTLYSPPQRRILVPQHDGKPDESGYYDAVVEASCYCSSMIWSANHPAWLRNSPRNSCIFHEACPKSAKHPRAVWLSPHHEQYFLPTRLPQFSGNLETKKKLCVVGNPMRRHWGLLARYLENTQTPVAVSLHGEGAFPKALKPYQENVQQHSSPDYLTYHQNLVSECAAIVLLVTPKTHPNYFSKYKKLTGAIPIAINYRLATVLHQDLKDLYRLEKSYGHGEDYESFASAMDRMRQEVGL